MAHHLFSQEQDMLVASFDKFNSDEIRNAIKKHLNTNPTDTIEHCKDFSKSDIKKYYGYEIINFYVINPKSKLPSKVVEKNGKEYYYKL